MSANTPENDPGPAAPAGLTPVPVDPWVLADVAYARYHDPHEVDITILRITIILSAIKQHS